MNPSRLPTGASARSATPSSEGRSWLCARRPGILAPSLILLVGLAAYANSFWGPFIFDDPLSIVENPTIRQLSSIGQVLSPPCDCRSVTSRPLLNLSLAINYSLGGLDVRGYHVTNLTIHLLASLLLLGILRRTFQLPALRSRFGHAAWPLALAITLLWTVHPLQTESVTYIIQRAESLAGLFYLLTLYSVIRGSQSSCPAYWYFLATAACFLGVGVKEIVSTAPVLVLLYDRTFLAHSFRKILRQRWGLYLGLSVSWALQLGLLARTGLRVLHDEVGPVGMWPYARSQAGVILHYLRLSFWPHPLCLDYDWPVANTLPEVLPGAIVIAMLLAVTLWGLMKHRSWSFQGVSFFLILAPTSSIMPLPHLAFEHRMYLSLAAVVAAVVLSCHAVGQGMLRRGWLSVRVGRIVAVCLTASTAVILALVTFHRNQTYQSRLAMWEATLVAAPHNSWAHTSYGACLPASRASEAIEHYRESLRLNPENAGAHYNWGFALASEGRLPEAIEHYQQALRLKPDFAEVEGNLAAALVSVGRSEEALAHFQKAVELEPGRAESHQNLASTLASTGRLSEAIEHYRRALQIKPDSSATEYGLACAMAGLGHLSEAIAHYAQATRLQPDFAEAHLDWGSTLVALNRFPEAIDHFRQAIRLKPDLPAAHCSLSSALAQTGNFREAIKHAREAVRLAPDDPQPNRIAATLLASQNSADQRDATLAIQLAQHACDLTARQDIPCLDTLASAYATAGRFPEAIATAKEAWHRANATGQTALAEELHMRLQLYRDHKPYREPTARPKTNPH
jgi:tetratricopeptide (TPR) repeat protein